MFTNEEYNELDNITSKRLYGKSLSPEEIDRLKVLIHKLENQVLQNKERFALLRKGMNPDERNDGSLSPEEEAEYMMHRRAVKVLDWSKKALLRGDAINSMDATQQQRANARYLIGVAIPLNLPNGDFFENPPVLLGAIKVDEISCTELTGLNKAAGKIGMKYYIVDKEESQEMFGEDLELETLPYVSIKNAQITYQNNDKKQHESFVRRFINLE